MRIGRARRFDAAQIDEMLRSPDAHTVQEALLSLTAHEAREAMAELRCLHATFDERPAVRRIAIACLGVLAGRGQLQAPEFVAERLEILRADPETERAALSAVDRLAAPAAPAA